MSIQQNKEKNCMKYLKVHLLKQTQGWEVPCFYYYFSFI